MSDEIKALAARVKTLEKGAQQTESQLAIANLQCAYGAYVRKILYDEAAYLFTRNATLEIAGRGHFTPPFITLTQLAKKASVINSNKRSILHNLPRATC